MKKLFLGTLLALCIGCTDRSDLLVGSWQLYYVYGTDAEHAEFAYETDWEENIYQLRPDGTGVCTDDSADADSEGFDWTLTSWKLGIRYCNRDTGYEYYDVEMLTADELVLKYAFRSCGVVRYQCYRRMRERSNCTSRNK